MVVGLLLIEVPLLLLVYIDIEEAYYVLTRL